MSLYLGGKAVAGVYLGDRRVMLTYRGSQLVWSAAPPTTWHTVFPWTYSWLADDLADGAVASWVDGQAGVTLTQATSSKQPVKAATTGANSQPAVTFDGVNDVLKDAGIVSVSQPDTIVFIARAHGATGSTTQWWCDGTSPTSRQLVGVLSGQWRQYAGMPTAGGSADDAWHPHVDLFAGAASRSRVDGIATSTSPGGNALSGLSVGNAAAEGSPAALDVCAIGIVSGDATTKPEWGALAALIDTKWGLVA